MKENASKRQDSIRRQLTNFKKVYEDGQRSKETVIAETHMGAGSQYFVSPSFGNKSPMSTMPNLNST